jgi:hypothetical protein
MLRTASPSVGPTLANSREASGDTRTCDSQDDVGIGAPGIELERRDAPVHALVDSIPDRIPLTVSLLSVPRLLPASRAVIVSAARSRDKA